MTTSDNTQATGPLHGVKVLEIAGIGPGPFAAMMLADMGADVVRVDRESQVGRDPQARADVLNRGRRSIAVDLKSESGLCTVKSLARRADILVEGFRPGVMERLGLGPEDCAQLNQALVYARMTGWGQEGNYAMMAGHDINYISLSGALGHLGHRDERPLAPLNLVGDFGGGGMLMAFGIVCALHESRASGRGQVIDTAMIDGASLLMTMFWGMKALGRFSNERGTNLLDSGAPFYDTYRCADGKYVAVGAIEPQFFAQLCAIIDVDLSDLDSPQLREHWPVVRERFTEAFQSRTRDEWWAKAIGTDACLTPVLTLDEAADDENNKQRGYLINLAGIDQPSPAPRFGRSHPAAAAPPPFAGEHSAEILSDWGVDS